MAINLCYLNNKMLIYKKIKYLINDLILYFRTPLEFNKISEFIII